MFHKIQKQITLYLLRLKKWREERISNEKYFFENHFGDSIFAFDAKHLSNATDPTCNWR